MQTTISKGLVNRNLRYAAELGIIYLNNPKAGCSTVKYSLWSAVDDMTGRHTFAGNVHARRADPFVRDIFSLYPEQLAQFSAASMFSIARNPFSRTLAAYLDKIPDDPTVWTVFHENFGLRECLTRDDFSFGDFLRLVEVASPDLLDGHFRPQSDNLLQPYAKPNFVGHLEDMGPTEKFLAGFGVVLRDRVRHATRSADQVGAYYDTDCIELVRKIYAEDFALLGYSACIGDAKLAGYGARNGATADGENDAIKQWVISGEPPAGTISDVPDIRSFLRAPTPESRRDIIRTALKRDNKWSRLRTYERYARRRMREEELSAALLEKMAALRARYEQAVRDPAIFRPMRRCASRK